MKKTSSVLGVLFLVNFLPSAFAFAEDGAPADAANVAVCPVCRVHEGETEAEEVLASAEYDDTAYGFCSTDCRDTFLESPEAYLPPIFPRPAPAFTVRDLGGTVHSLEMLRGRVVLLDFWATWCAPCVDDLPKLARLHERHKDAGLTVLSLSIDEDKGAERKVSRLVRKRQATHPVALDGGDTPAWAAYFVRVVPAQYLIDQDGHIVAQWSGKTDLAVVEDEIVRLLDGRETAGESR